MSTIDMNAVVAALNERGIRATVERTGGNVATIYAGRLSIDGRNECVAGPGVWSDDTPLADTSEFFIGPDDDGDSEAYSTTDADTVATIADRIAAQVTA